MRGRYFNLPWHYFVISLCLGACVEPLRKQLFEAIQVEGSQNVTRHHSRERFSFTVQRFDNESGLIRRYLLFYYPDYASFEMFDLDTITKKTVKSQILENRISIEELYIGGAVTILGKKFVILDFADGHTRNVLGKRTQRTLAMIKPDGVAHLGKIMQDINNAEFRISKGKMVQMTKDQVMEFYEEHQGKLFQDKLVDYIASGPVIPFELVRDNAMSHWRSVLGSPGNPSSVRAKYGTSKFGNAAHGSDTIEAAVRELDFFFPTRKSKIDITPQPTTAYRNSTACFVSADNSGQKTIGPVIQDFLVKSAHLIGFNVLQVVNTKLDGFKPVLKKAFSKYPEFVSKVLQEPTFMMEFDTDSLNRNKFEELNQLYLDWTNSNFISQSKLPKSLYCINFPPEGISEIETLLKFLS